MNVYLTNRTSSMIVYGHTKVRPGRYITVTNSWYVSNISRVEIMGFEASLVRPAAEEEVGIDKPDVSPDVSDYVLVPIKRHLYETTIKGLLSDLGNAQLNVEFPVHDMNKQDLIVRVKSVGVSDIIVHDPIDVVQPE